MGVISRSVPAMAQDLLGWWQINGRCDSAQKPWMVNLAGRWPTVTDELDLYGIRIGKNCSSASCQRRGGKTEERDKCTRSSNQ